MKRTKIVATIGPASESLDILQKLSDAGVNVFRLNFSHGDHGEHGQKIDNIRKLNLPGAIMLDTKGPEIRTGQVNGALEVKTGDKVTFTIDKGIYEETKKVSVSYPEFLKDVSVGTKIVIDSGVIVAEVESISGNDIFCKIIKGSGKITTKRHINLMGKHVSLPTITENDWKDIEFGIEKKVDFIALSFVRAAKDIEEVREFCRKKGFVPQIISKIENVEAMENLEEIVEASDAIMVARGDLACEIPYYDVPSAQRAIVELCSEYAKPVIIATQMLLSMVENISPTRAEVSDVANAVFQDADAVMTSDETTKSFDPVNVIETMSAIVSANENLSIVDGEETDDSEEMEQYAKTALVKSAIMAAEEIVDYASAIVVITKSGDMARQISNERPELPILAFTDNDLACNTMHLMKGVYPTVIKFDKNNYENTVKEAEKVISNLKDFKVKNYVLVSYYMADGKEYGIVTIRKIR